MILTAHQPVYLPWLGLFHKIMLADAFVSFDAVQYVPKDFINRNKILAAGRASWLTVPVLDKDYQNGLNINEAKIKNSLNWRKKHWKTIYLNYKKTAHFDRFAPFFEDLYSREWETIAELNEHILRYLLSELGINIKWYRLSELGVTGYKNELVLNMCRKLEADLYIFGELGRDYADRESFNRAGIEVIFQKYEHPVYPQAAREFVSHLSVIDLLFNAGSERAREIIGSGNISREELVSACAVH